MNSAALDAAREHISNLEKEEDASKQAAAEARVAAVDRATADARARAEAEASASSAKYERLSQKRAAGQEREAQ